MMKFVAVLAILMISNVVAFNVMKSSSIITRKPLSMSLTDAPLDVIAAKTQLMSQALLVSDAGPVETSVAFLFIAAAIMGALQDFLKAFDKK